MALYMYMISVDQLDDSVFTPLFHEKKYTSKEFTDICNGIKNEIDNELDELTFQEEFIKIAINEYGFKKLNVLKFNISNMNNKSTKRWMIVKRINGEQVYFGSYKTEEEAENRVEELKKNNWKKE